MKIRLLFEDQNDCIKKFVEFLKTELNKSNIRIKSENKFSVSGYFSKDKFGKDVYQTRFRNITVFRNVPGYKKFYINLDLNIYQCSDNFVENATAIFHLIGSETSGRVIEYGDNKPILLTGSFKDCYYKILDSLSELGRKFNELINLESPLNSKEIINPSLWNYKPQNDENDKDDYTRYDDRY